MNAAIKGERSMVEESRIVRLEEGVRHLQEDVTELKAEFKGFRAEVGKEFAVVRQKFEEVDRRFEEAAKDNWSFRADVEKRFGEVGASIQSVHTAIERSKLWVIGTGVALLISLWGAALTLARMLKQ
jgi:hypothetical protein